MKTIAIIQARMNSTRLPEKILKPLCGKSILGHVITRVRACPELDDVVIATTTAPVDQAVVEEARRYGAQIFRGSEEDVLSRYFFAAQENSADVIARVTSDCPLYDPQLLTRMLAKFSADNSPVVTCDYLSNVTSRSFPRGLDTEIFSFAALERAHREATAPHQREHVTPYIHQNTDRFRLQDFANDRNLSRHRWTLDTPEDWLLISAVYQALYREDEIFSTAEILDFLEKHPEIFQLNAQVEQKKLGN